MFKNLLLIIFFLYLAKATTTPTPTKSPLGLIISHDEVNEIITKTRRSPIFDLHTINPGYKENVNKSPYFNNIKIENELNLNNIYESLYILIGICDNIHDSGISTGVRLKNSIDFFGAAHVFDQCKARVYACNQGVRSFFIVNQSRIIDEEYLKINCVATVSVRTPSISNVDDIHFWRALDETKINVNIGITIDESDKIPEEVVCFGIPGGYKDDIWTTDGVTISRNEYEQLIAPELFPVYSFGQQVNFEEMLNNTCKRAGILLQHGICENQYLMHTQNHKEMMKFGITTNATTIGGQSGGFCGDPRTPDIAFAVNSLGLQLPAYKDGKQVYYSIANIHTAFAKSAAYNYYKHKEKQAGQRIKKEL